MGIYEELVARGLIAQVTNEEEIRTMINAGKATFYIGFDCTADSLTAGHFMALTLMKRLQMAGNRPIALIGGGTTMIGDPSGRTDMRKMLTKDDINHNAECFRRQMERFIEFGEGKAQMVNNGDWLLNLNYIELLRDVGACFSVNNMLRAKCYEQRMEKGLSFLEFNYMIMQSYDFYYLFREYGCNMQFGGDDQWSNMLGGTELIRRKLGKDAHAMTITLLTDSQGKKMGKTAGNAVWLDPKKTSPYDFFQYWRNVDDSDVMKCIRMLTFLPLEQIDEMDRWEGADLNRAKEILAYELTKMVHGTEEADRALETSKKVFAQGGVSDDMPTTTLSADDFTDGRITVIDMLVKSRLAPSKGEARRLIQQGGIMVGDAKVDAITAALETAEFADGVILKKGKKVYHRFVSAD
ncbi:MAG: tyrosine--tRNA ligase [Eubacteriales bacterium]|uniref:Tyrosine--tRNA ligase n=1 Tax=Candidatus Colimorpha enterica TaxID=3083063 RepID=R6TWC8_9BACT|nr:tyrosine--tRNA ligase [Candidatus Colimorpha enterica]CDC72211.1 tyrosine--tRNA ligase [Candidatus Colimorpha enterica]